MEGVFVAKGMRIKGVGKEERKGRIVEWEGGRREGVVRMWKEE